MTSSGATAARWLSVIGTGDDGPDGLGAAARRILDSAQIIIGAERHLAQLPDDGRTKLRWPTPFNAMSERLAQYRGTPVCVLATGDPCCHGVGTVLARSFAREEMTIIPAPSAFSLACARLGWSMAQVDTLSVHGRPLERLHPFLVPKAQILLLSENGTTPAKVSALLCARGFGDSVLHVLAHMGSSKETAVTSRASEWAAQGEIPALNTIAIECIAAPGTTLLPRSAGLPNDAYEHDGQLTKREVRAITLAALAPVPGQRLWDVGAGCGSIAIEWMRHDPRCKANAIERNTVRLNLIARNALALGTPELDITDGEAPAVLDDLPKPDAIFVGGGLSEPLLLQRCWQALDAGGRLVANAVSLEGESVLANWQAHAGGQLVRIAIERAEPVGRFRGWRPARPVTQYAVTKDGSHV